MKPKPCYKAQDENNDDDSYGTRITACLNCLFPQHCRTSVLGDERLNSSVEYGGASPFHEGWHQLRGWAHYSQYRPDKTPRGR